MLGFYMKNSDPHACTEIYSLSYFPSPLLWGSARLAEQWTSGTCPSLQRWELGLQSGAPTRCFPCAESQTCVLTLVWQALDQMSHLFRLGSLRCPKVPL